MRNQGAHQYTSAIERVNLSRARGGRGVHGALLTWEKEVVSVAMYLTTARVELVREAVSSLEAGDGHSVLMDARQVLRKYKLRGVLPRRGQPQSNAQPWRIIKRQLERAQQEGLLEQLGKKKIHGAHLNQTQRPQTDLAATHHRWLVQGRLRAETEAVVVAAQCGTLGTNAYKVEVQGMYGSTKCRLCQGERETIGHILSSCPEHTWCLIKIRHDKMYFSWPEASWEHWD